MAEEKFYEENAWTLLFLMSIVALAFAVIGLLGIPVDPQGTVNLTGMTPEELEASHPDISRLINVIERASGLGLLMVGVLGMAVAAIPYRRGERWAWYAYWIVPAALLGYLANDLNAEGTLWPLLTLFVIISVLGLLLPYRKFFPR